MSVSVDRPRGWITPFLFPTSGEAGGFMLVSPVLLLDLGQHLTPNVCPVFSPWGTWASAPSV